MQAYVGLFICADQWRIEGGFRPGGGGGGGGTLIFSTYVGSGPASTVHLQKISGISSTPKKYLKFYNQKKYPLFCILTR